MIRLRLVATQVAALVSLALLAPATAHAQTAVLHPGTIRGTVDLGTPLSWVTINASSGDGYHGSTSVNAPCVRGTVCAGAPTLGYAVTVEGDHAYKLTAQVGIFNATASRMLVISRNTPVPVAVGGVATSDFVYALSPVAVTVEVLGGGGTIRDLNLSIQTPTTTCAGFPISTCSPALETYWSSASQGYTTGPTRVTVVVPAVAAMGATLSGSVGVNTATGTVFRTISNIVLNIPAGGTSAYTSVFVAPASLGTLQGTVTLNNLLGPEVIRSHSVRASGASTGARSAQLTGNGPYTMADIPSDTYWVTFSTVFDPPYLALQALNAGISVYVPAGGVGTANFGYDLGFAHGVVELSGFATAADATIYAVAHKDRYYGTSFLWNASDTASPAGDIDFAVIPGTWEINDYYLTFSNAPVSTGGGAGGPLSPGGGGTTVTPPADPLSVNIWEFDYSDTAETFTVAGGGQHALTGLASSVAESRIIFDVFEAPGQAETMVSGPQLNLSRGTIWDVGTTITATGPSAAAAHPSVRFMGFPGTYQVRATAYVNGSFTTFGNFEITLHDPVCRSPGADVDFQAHPDVALNFSQLLTGGCTTATVSPIGPQVPGGFKLAAPGESAGSYIDVTSNATWSGPITICIHYSDDPVLIPWNKEPHMKLMHYDAARGKWEDITTSRDPVNNLVCGVTDSFSVFAAMFPEADEVDSDADGILDDVDNCPDALNSDQEDTDSDATGDACDSDDDGDGIFDVSDSCPSTANADQADSDSDGAGDACDEDDDDDGVSDGLDNCAYVANPAQADYDGDAEGDACDNDADSDGVPNTSDNCAFASNADQDDIDGDGDGDACDADDDGDGTSDETDNCATVGNADQGDLDGDGLGDACDGDDDGDGVGDADDNCQRLANVDQTDTDGDAQGDGCDADDDGDGVSDGADNCPVSANAEQADNDADLWGDLCDPDDDNDAVRDELDNCAFAFNSDQGDNDADGEGDACDLDDDNDSVADELDNCAFTSNGDQTNRDGDILGDVCDPDDDNDGVLDGDDNCSWLANTDQTDSDGDGEGDACDPDDDNDDVADWVDNCPNSPNVDQADFDSDSQGDACDDDTDGDSVANDSDNCVMAPNSGQEDMDADGLGDSCDPDQDGDNARNGVDNCPTVANEDQSDNEGDGLGDVCDDDDDNDGVSDDSDNCSLASNALQRDSDGDGSGDACDVDDDDDGVRDISDNCPLVENSAQSDAEADGLGDACDDDDDNDGVNDERDNCHLTANGAQSDFDRDGSGDACDADVDGDGVANANDTCGGTALGATVDRATGCSIAQLCPCASPRGQSLAWKNHGQYVSCVSQSSQSFVKAGLIAESVRSGIVSSAAQDRCGD